MITLDGSHGEGGGSILRQALACSIITGKEFNIKKIRAGRPKPGLSHQHLASLNAAAKICNATLWGNELGSTEVYFKPGKIKSGNYRFEIGTAGSATLLLQSVLFPAVFSKKKTSFTIMGGTDVSWSSPFDYFKSVFIPQIKKFADIEANLFKRGYFPSGGGEIKVSVSSKFSFADDDIMPAILLEKKERLLQIRGVSHASRDLESSHVSERQAESAGLKLKILNSPVNISSEYSSSDCTGSGLVLWAIFGNDEIDFQNPVVLGSSCLGERAKKAETLGVQAAENMIKEIESDACADEYLCDQLIPYLAVAGGKIQTDRITDHTLSNIYVAEQFFDVKFEIKDNKISCIKKRTNMKYLDDLKKLNLPLGRYVIFGSGPLAIRGLRENDDLDILVEANLWKELSEKYSLKNENSIKIGAIELFKDWKPWFENSDELIDTAEMIDGFPFVNLDNVLKFKKSRNKDKDKADICLIESFLKKKSDEKVKRMRDTTLCLPLRENQILLGMKKKSFGAGKWNGFGGKVEPGETIEQATVRELLEESGISAAAKDLEKVAVIDFRFSNPPPGKIWDQRVHIFTIKHWKGEPYETNEMLPRFFELDKIPYKDMWNDDIIWLPKILSGKKIQMDVLFGEDNESISSYDLTEINSF